MGDGQWGGSEDRALQMGTGSFQGPGHIQKCTGWRGPRVEATGHGGGRTGPGRTVRELVHHIKDLGSSSGREPSEHNWSRDWRDLPLLARSVNAL